MSGACYADGLLGKPAGEPGLAEYFSDVDGVCVKDSSYVTCPDLTCCDIDALARFSYRATRERPLPAAPRRSRARFSESPPTLRDLLPVFPRPAADRPSPPCAASSAVCRSFPSPPATVSCSASASSSPSSPPPWYVHAVRTGGNFFVEELRGFPERTSRLSPKNPHSRFIGFDPRAISRETASRCRRVRHHNAKNFCVFFYFRLGDIFFVLCGEDRQMEKKRPPTDEPSLPLTPKQITQTPYTPTGVHGPALRRHEHLL